MTETLQWHDTTITQTKIHLVAFLPDKDNITVNTEVKPIHCLVFIETTRCGNESLIDYQ